MWLLTAGGTQCELIFEIRLIESESLESIPISRKMASDERFESDNSNAYREWIESLRQNESILCYDSGYRIAEFMNDQGGGRFYAPARHLHQFEFIFLCESPGTACSSKLFEQFNFNFI